jgi:hypothetical protein
MGILFSNPITTRIWGMVSTLEDGSYLQIDFYRCVDSHAETGLQMKDGSHSGNGFQIYYGSQELLVFNMLNGSHTPTVF